jgi:hypothetical protein
MNETSATFIGSEVERRKWKQTEKEDKTNGITGNHKNVHLRVQTVLMKNVINSNVSFPLERPLI